MPVTERLMKLTIMVTCSTRFSRVNRSYSSSPSATVGCLPNSRRIFSARGSQSSVCAPPTVKVTTSRPVIPQKAQKRRGYLPGSWWVACVRYAVKLRVAPGWHFWHVATDPRSHLSRDSVVATCQKCHPGATRSFTAYLTHATHHEPGKYPLLFWVFWGMTGLLVVTFTVGGAHTLLWLPRALKIRREFGRHPAVAEGELEYERFTRLNRVLHVIMIVSFISLALTGMTLKFSYTRWASVLSHLLGGFETAGYIHRTAAVAMICVFIAHIIDVIRRKRREKTPWKDLLFGPKSMMLGRKDLAEFAGSIKWFLGLGKRPNYGRWTYWEKFDYFAVFWGIVVIGSTGLLLWFPTFFARFLPGWLVNVATIIHSDEALLATGFIFTIHFFN